MMEIKFRAWDKENKYMGVIFDSVKQKDWFVPSWTDRYVVMQYLNILDKNGVEIYEGDIVRLPLVDRGNGDIAVFEFTAPNYILKGKKGYYEISIGKKSRSESYEVMGNIFENPELIR